MKRGAGILLSVSSLPSEFGIGCFDKQAYRFIDFLKASGQSYWQILPLGPTGYGDSPYQSFSVFAGNPYYISLDEFIRDGLLTEKECSVCCAGTVSDSVDYSRLYTERYALLQKAYRNSGTQDAEAIEAFARSAEWLNDYALFMALKNHFGGRPLSRWDNDIRMRTTDTIERYTAELSDEIGFQKFLQYHFHKQWSALRSYANQNGVEVIGDIPVYAAADSADVWTHPELFQLDRDRLPLAVAGCPPDGFAADGQLWGNPLYNWEYHKSTDYRWWISRLKHCFTLYDVVRIDHFRGFDEYYSIPYGEKTAGSGTWKKGPGIGLFRAAEAALGKMSVIAEDLGFMTDSVKKLVKDCGFPNMKVLEFAFDSRDTGSGSDHMPHNYGENCVVYTGTHDNQTIVSWFSSISEAERNTARDYLCDNYTPEKQLHISFISLIMRSRAKLCIIPMQDWLGLDDRARMNTPSTVGSNWRWRLKPHELSDRLCEDISKITEMYGRSAVERKQHDEKL